MKLNWKHLLNEERRRPTRKNKNDYRNEFERDYDRSIYTPYFRKLQDKAQVFPLEHDDFVRTRLTHSIEVSSLGRAFGVDVVQNLKQKKLVNNNEIDSRKVSALLSTVCLLHDIGNPPFGHFGEESIRMWFKDWFKMQEELKEKEPNNYFIDKLTKEQKNDFLFFEGNAQTLRIVTLLQCLDDENGLNLTYGTLAGLIKYPTDSSNINEDIKAKSKFGYFQAEKEIYEEIQQKCKLFNARHPLAILMEAADDIAWSIIDIEDALRKGSIQYEEFIEYMNKKQKIVNKQKRWDKFLKNREKHREKWGFIRSSNIALQKFRIDLIGDMFRDCVAAFVDNYESIMEGEFTDSLIKKSKSAKVNNVLCGFAREHIYKDRAILAMEVVGCEVIHTLLNFLVINILNNKENKVKKYEGKIYNLLGPVLRKLHENYTKRSIYDQLLLATDFISGLTDTYALNLYQKWSGIKLRK